MNIGKEKYQIHQLSDKWQLLPLRRKKGNVADIKIGQDKGTLEMTLGSQGLVFEDLMMIHEDLAIGHLEPNN